MSRKRKNRSNKPRLHHAAVERELLRMHQQGQSVEKRHNMLRSVLIAVAHRYGPDLDITQSDLQAARGATIEFLENPADDTGMRIQFVAAEGEDEKTPVEVPTPKAGGKWWPWALGIAVFGVIGFAVMAAM